MKKIFMILLIFVAATTTFTSCSSDDEPFFTATENDAPRILNTDIPEWNNGSPGILKTIERNTNFTFEIIVTPADFTTVTWLLDDEKIAEGKSIDIPLLAGDYTLKIIATTGKGLETSRTCQLVVNPCNGDPIATTDNLMERLVAPGANTTLRGENMNQVTKVIIGNQEANATYNVEGYVEYTVPAGLSDGKYALSLKDANGTQYGAGYITVTSSPTVSNSKFAGKSGAVITLTGQNLDKIGSITIDGKECEITGKTAVAIAVKTPTLEAGDYDMKAVDANGAAVKFINGSEFTEMAKFTVTSEVAIWKGNWNVTWATPFDGLKSTMKDLVSSGTVVRIYVSGNGLGAATTAWWNNILTGLGDPNRGDIVISGDQILEYTLTDYSIQLMNEQDGFLIVGDGYTISRITVE
ncbi:IPT/TIG domain-containing protein [uncultured Bacteroides sp.]|uniref:IPT/TIG domain-containing protein n=1 Tax=uncultured Bacteroides sp. TaxID=162156 RepID=UPI00262CACDB|nr:IPT/TIG domain-containing protein [uncultured Bacteroides sp.]